jgi:hypothetical protein
LKKIFIIALFLTPLSIFSQEIKRTNLAFTAGINFSALSEDFQKNYPLGINAGFHHEWTANDNLSLGWEFNFEHCFPKKVERDPIQPAAVQFFTKFQDNTAQKNFQHYVKAGAGLGVVGKESSGGHPGSFPAFAIAFTGGTGLNYFLKNGDNLFTELSYRGFHTSSYYSSVSLNFGYSFWLNKTAQKINH